MWDREIDIREIGGLRIGHAQDNTAKTGVTARVFPEGAWCGCRISGGGPASRETSLTYSETAENKIHAVVLSGGSAFGLAASQGVMSCLEEHGIGFDTHYAKVPLVCQSCLFDLSYGSSTVRPTPEMGYEACEAAFRGGSVAQGNVGAGTGATVGKLRTMKNAMKSGLGWYAVQIGELRLAAIVAVNALGDIFDPRTGEELAGMRTDDRSGWLSVEECMADLYRAHCSQPADTIPQNTTIGAVITNAAFGKAQMNKIAAMTVDAYARCIRPAATMMDGDTVYAASTGNVSASLDFVGTLSAAVMERAIVNAVKQSQISEEEFLSSIVQ